MALQDFLGKTIEIKIIDFLSQNSISNYNQTEISDCLNISRTSVNQKLPELIFNGIVEVKERKGNSNYYQLSNNGVVNKLVGSVFENGLFISKYEDSDENEIKKLKKDIVEINYTEESEFGIDQLVCKAPKIQYYKDDTKCSNDIHLISA
ncbi:winged helix-turn-helix domain-containing protein [Methanolapillus ohkumae]|uniref:Winged helix-turn-helix transcriptional regulator n=1 Tax=Methanolapillus ohkumae TaxID=3028298 RepID=A0AA96V6N5_9EURY|nr:hypothetical protein MsAm2_13090 [Methanosarcinaceae archaeon Am2]